VVEAASGYEAIEVIGKTPFDLVLMDLSMPDIDGFETTRRIRQIEGNDKLPILALTAHSSKKDQAKCEAAGMNAVLRKPFNSEQVDRVLTLIDLEHKGPKS
jgi:CheY-like chemotaxis protein